MITNKDTTELVHVLVYVMFGMGFINIILILVMKLLFDYIRDVEVKLIAQTSPEHKALTRAYFNTLYEEHKKNRQYDERLDKMFKDD